MEPQTFPNLSCLIERDEETGQYIGHCLNYDLMDCAPTPKEVWENLKYVMKNHIEYCYTHHQAGLARGAKKQDWDRFFEAVKANPGSVTTEKLELDLKPPTLPEQEFGIWVQQVQSAGNSPDVQTGCGSVQVN